MLNSGINKGEIYNIFPVWVQNIICSVEGWRINRSRYDKNFIELLRDKQKKTYCSYEEICSYRDNRLIKYLDWSYKTVPYYRRLLKRLGILPGDFKSIGDLQKIPILTKKEVQDKSKDFISEKIPPKKQVMIHTSGSTGGGLRFASTKDAIQEQFAIHWRFLGWHGFKSEMWRGYFGGRSIVPINQHRPPFWRYNFPGWQIIFSGYHMSDGNLMYFIDKINKSKPSWLIGYPSLVTLLADYLLTKGKFLDYKLKGIALCSENLMPHQIQKMEKAFGVKPIQDYGQTEAVANFSECEYGNLHVDEDFSAVQFIHIDDNKYRVVGTNFTNLATPLINYDTGDIVSLNGEKCNCGRPGRVVKEVDGRKEDYVILENGAKLGRMDHVFKDFINIREAQIYQRIPGQIEVRIVKGRNYTDKDELLLLYELRKRVGDETQIYLNYVTKLERTSRGKLRFVISDIDEGMNKY